jgi:histidine triad (HIT) family protein
MQPGAVRGKLPGMSDCIFCRIASGSIPARVLFADDELLAFHDVAPQAPAHVLVIPKRHIGSLAEATPGDGELLGRLLAAAARAAREAGIAETGYRVVSNSGATAGQSVPHLHFHVMGGRTFGWPPG